MTITAPETTTRVFVVHPDRRAQAADRLAALDAQAAKVGAEVTYEVTEFEKTNERTNLPEIWQRITVEFEQIALDGGWTLTAVWDLQDGVGVTAPGAPDGTLARTKDIAETGDCFACGTKRDRHNVFVVRDEDGQEVAVGSTCVKDFLGVTPTQFLGVLSFARDAEEWGWGDPELDPLGGNFTPAESPVAYVAVANAVIRTFGFASKTKAAEWGRASTAEETETWLYGRGKAAEALRDEVGGVTDEDVERAREVVAFWADEANATNDFTTTLHQIAKADTVNPFRYGGFLAAAPSAYAQETERRAERAAEKAEASPVPVNGERITVVGEVVTLQARETQWGPTIKALVKADAGFRLWGTLPSALRGRTVEGDRIQFDAAVEPSNDDPTFGFFNRPTKAKAL